MAIQDIIGGIAQEHFDIESGLRAIAVFSEDRDNEMRIIEVNENALPTGQVEPFVFAPQEKALVPIYIADVTPDEWEAICNGKILLPDGWPKHPFRVIQRDVNDNSDVQDDETITHERTRQLLSTSGSNWARSIISDREDRL